MLDQFSRTKLLLGQEAMEKLKASQYLCVAAVIIGIVLMGIAEGIGEG